MKNHTFVKIKSGKNYVVKFGGGGAMQVLGDRAVQFNCPFLFQLLYKGVLVNVFVFQRLVNISIDDVFGDVSSLL